MPLLRKLLLCCLAAGASLAVAQVDITGPARVLDGDTLNMEGVRIRLFGVDAPESSQSCTRANGSSWPCGTAASEALQQKIGQQAISCRRRDVDDYGRIVAVCRLGNEDLNAWLAQSGWVVAYQEYSRDYVDEEASARAARRNIWSGSFQQPAEYRRQQGNNRAAATNDPNCRIKGNISTKGDRIYHVPGGEFYQQTVISAAQGERMFCSEQEAQAAGWRKSRR